MKIPSRRYTGPDAGGWVHPQSPRRQVNRYKLQYMPGGGWAYTLGGAPVRLVEHGRRLYSSRAEAIDAASALGIPVDANGEVEVRLVDVT
jgi:hypothetical protein